MMKRSVVVVALMLGLVMVVAGCASSGGGKSPEELIKAKIDAWKTAMVAKDIKGIMANFSDKFENDEWGDKAGAERFISDAIDAGYMDGIEIADTDAKIKVEGDKGTVYPIDISGSFGSITLELALTKEKAGWMVTGVEASGL
jgi:hypothetical protein